MPKCENPTCTRVAFGGGLCFKCKKEAKSTEPASQQTKPPPPVTRKPAKTKPPRPVIRKPAKPKLPRPKPRGRASLVKELSEPQRTGTSKTVFLATGPKSNPEPAPAEEATPAPQSAKPPPRQKKTPPPTERNTVDTLLPPIVFIQTRYSWLGYKTFGSTINKYLTSLEREVRKRPGGSGFSFNFRVLQPNNTNPDTSDQNVDLDLSCFKYANNGRKELLGRGRAEPYKGKRIKNSKGEWVWVSKATSTDTDFSEFMELFCGQEGVLTPVGPRLFAVTDANYAHNVAAAVAHRAFSDHDKSTKRRIIINFDQHEDCGRIDKASETIRCNNWGGFSLQKGSTPCPNAIADVYIVIGVPDPNNGAMSHAQHTLRSLNDKVMETGDEGIKKIIGWIKDEHWEKSLVFVTVDRDFFIGNGTPWGDGVYMPEAGRECVKDTLRQVKKLGATFVGFEVSGVPELNGVTRVNRLERAKKNHLGMGREHFLDRLATDIAFFWKLFNEDLK